MGGLALLANGLSTTMKCVMTLPFGAGLLCLWGFVGTSSEESCGLAVDQGNENRTYPLLQTCNTGIQQDPRNHPPRDPCFISLLSLTLQIPPSSGELGVLTGQMRRKSSSHNAKPFRLFIQ